MKAYKFETVVIDFEGYDIEEYINQIQNLNCIGKVNLVSEHNIGEWDDDHILNRGDVTEEDRENFLKITRKL